MPFDSDVARGHDARPLGRDRQPLRTVDVHLDADALQVQDDVGHVFTHASNRRELVQHVVDLDGGDGPPLQRRHQHAAQRVAQRQAKPRSSGSAMTVATRAHRPPASRPAASA